MAERKAARRSRGAGIRQSVPDHHRHARDDDRFGDLSIFIRYWAGERFRHHPRHRFAGERVHFDLRFARDFRLEFVSPGSPGSVEYLGPAVNLSAYGVWS